MYFTLAMLLILLPVLYWVYWRQSRKRMLELAEQIPGPPALPFIGNALKFITNPKDQIKIIASLFDTYGDYLRFWLGPDLLIAVKNPADIRMLLTSNKVNEKGPLYNFMIPFIGPGVLAGGPKWRAHRKIATPSYNKKAVEMFMPIFNAEAEELTKVLSKKGNITFNVYHDVVQRTTSTVCQTLMGLSKEEGQNLKHLQYIIKETPTLYDLIFRKMTRWWLQIPLIFWLSGNYAVQKNFVKHLDEFISDVVDRRKRALEKEIPPEEKMGIVDRYILSGEMSYQEIKWDSFTLFTTSQEAAAKIASGVLMILGQYPVWQKRVYNEVMEVIGPDQPVTPEQLKQLPCLDMVYKETLRYFSIAGMIQRRVEDEITICNGKITLPKGTSLIIPIHEIHRHKDHWEDPLKINPDRFLPENVAKRDPNAFVPFSLGPMDCLGRVYATAMIKTMVVHVIRKLELESNEPVDDLDLEIAISVKAANGYNITARPRGINGYMKANGINGINGINGVNGIHGVNSINSIKGVNGIHGVNGINSIKGVNGIHGVNGINGINGIYGLNNNYVYEE